jgi:predicted nucleotidyltransferase
MVKVIGEILGENFTNNFGIKFGFKVREIGIFGSVIRGEQKETSDFDLPVEFEKPIGFIKYARLLTSSAIK